jgi:hypothetical protein
VGDTVFINGRAVVHKGSAGKSIAFPDVCLCPPTPPAGPIPTPLPNTVQAADLDGGASSVLTEGNPIGKQSSFFAKSTGNEASQPTGGGVVTTGVQGKAYFQSYSPDVMIEGEPAVRHLDLLTHNHIAQAPGNTPPVPWLSTQSLPPTPPPPLRTRPSDGPGLTLTIKTSSGESAEDLTPLDISEAGGSPAATKLVQGKLDKKKPKGVVVVTFRELRRAFWTKFTAAPGEPVELAVLSSGFPDGTKGTFEIRHAGQPSDAPPLETIDFTLNESKARAEWKYQQPLGGAPNAGLIFVARIDEKLAYSPPLRIKAYPLVDVRGVKQWLRAFGYEAGPPDPSQGGPLEGALRKFQGDHAPLEVTGKLDAKTRNVLAGFAGGGT